jgi:hypothetical protein
MRLLVISALASAASMTMTTVVFANQGFGSRNTAPSTSPSAPVATPPSTSSTAPASASASTPASTHSTTSAPTQSEVATNLSEPPAIQDVDWIKVPFDQAENEVLALLKQDLPKIRKKAQRITIIGVRLRGAIPKGESITAREKIERVFLSDTQFEVKDCKACTEAKLIRGEDGQLRYEALSIEDSRVKEKLLALGTDGVLEAELAYHPEDLKVLIKIVHPETHELLFSKQYSTADIIKTRQNLDESAGLDTPYDVLTHRDAFSRVIIGEIAFTPVLSAGMSYYPSVDNGKGSALTSMPSVDLFMGEKFDRGRRVFGFQIGAAMNLGTKPEAGTPLPFIIHVAPKFKWVINPYNVTTAKWAITGELGGIIATGYSSGYLGIGPEMVMIKRFSVSLTPMYILKREAAPEQTLVEGDNGTVINAGTNGSAGEMGGFAIAAKVNINW